MIDISMITHAVNPVFPQHNIVMLGFEPALLPVLDSVLSVGPIHSYYPGYAAMLLCGNS